VALAGGTSRLVVERGLGARGLEAFAGREHNDLVLWLESQRAVVAGDSLADFGDGIATPPEWL
jgi:hypothetical protein